MSSFRWVPLVLIVSLSLFLVNCQSVPSLHDPALKTKEVSLSSLPQGALTTGLAGPENILVDQSRVYVSDLFGNVSLYQMGNYPDLKFVNRLKIGSLALGLSVGKDGAVYAIRSQAPKEGWLKTGGELGRISDDFATFTPLTASFPGINGLTSDEEGNLYFTTGNLDFFSPKGAVYKLTWDAQVGGYSEPKILRDGLKSPNGITYSTKEKALLLTEVFAGTSRLSLDGGTLESLMGKAKMVEGFDDLTQDSQGRIWVADAVGGLVKRFVPGQPLVTLFHLEGLGVASSVRVVGTGADESVLVTERERKQDNDGHVLLWIRLKDLE